ncbi:MAG: hypothetical protein MZV65_31835 [Chromatiales bacterium]|nr:hypothetical protein [Chromatiales bacterium]
MTTRYYMISYQGRELLKIYADSARAAKDRAIATFQREGRRGMNLARLDVAAQPSAGHQQEAAA